MAFLQEGLGQRDDYGGSSLDCAMDIFIGEHLPTSVKAAA